MAGLEKIKSQILDEAKETANVKIEDCRNDVFLYIRISVSCVMFM